MNRRVFVAAVGACMFTRFTAAAQPAGKFPRIGFLITGSSTDQRHLIEAFGQGLRELGWFEGR